MAILKVCQGIKCHKEAFNNLEMAFILSFLRKEAEEHLQILQQWNEVCQGPELHAETSFFQIHQDASLKSVFQRALLQRTLQIAVQMLKERQEVDFNTVWETPSFRKARKLKKSLYLQSSKVNTEKSVTLCYDLLSPSSRDSHYPFHRHGRKLLSDA